MRIATIAEQKVMKSRARVLFPALAWFAAVAWLVSPGFAQTMAPQSAMPAPEGMPFQAGPHGMMGGGVEGMMPMMRGMMAGRHAMMFDHVEGRIAFLKTELKITETQTAQRERFADSLRSTANSMIGMHRQMMQGGMPASLPDRLDLRENMLSAHLEALKHLRAALDPLYAAFSDEQKKLADELALGPMGMMQAYHSAQCGPQAVWQRRVLHLFACPYAQKHGAPGGRIALVPSVVSSNS